MVYIDRFKTGSLQDALLSRGPSNSDIASAYDMPPASGTDKLLQVLLPILSAGAEFGVDPDRRNWGNALSRALGTWSGVRGMQHREREAKRQRRIEAMGAGERARKTRVSERFAGRADERAEEEAGRARNEAAWRELQNVSGLRSDVLGRAATRAQIGATDALRDQRTESGGAKQPTPVHPGVAYGRSFEQAIEDVLTMAPGDVMTPDRSINPAYYGDITRRMNEYLTLYGLEEVTEEHIASIASRPAPPEQGPGFWSGLWDATFGRLGGGDESHERAPRSSGPPQTNDDPLNLFGGL